MSVLLPEFSFQATEDIVRVHTDGGITTIARSGNSTQKWRKLKNGEDIGEVPKPKEPEGGHVGKYVRMGQENYFLNNFTQNYQGNQITWEISLKEKSTGKILEIKENQIADYHPNLELVEFDFALPKEARGLGIGEKMMDDALATFSKNNSLKGVYSDWGTSPYYPGGKSLGLKQFWEKFDELEPNFQGQLEDLYKLCASETRLGKLMEQRNYVKVILHNTPMRDNVIVSFEK